MNHNQNLVQKPKLLIVVDTYYPMVDGTLKFVEEFTERTKKDFELSLLVPDLGKKRGERVNYLTVYKHIHLSGYPSIKLSFHNLRKIKFHLKKNDLVFVQGPALASYLSIYYGHKYKKKTFFYVHTITWEVFAKFLPPLINRLSYGIIKKFSLSMYNKCDEIFVPYLQLKDHLEKEGVKTKISVARLGVDIEKFSPPKNNGFWKKKLGLNENKKVIGYVGRISKEKNLPVLYDAFRKLPQQNRLFLLLVGDGPDDQTKRFKKLKNCKVTGFVENVEDYIKAMDVFVMPSLTETTSLATLEAMSCAVPVISTKVGFIKKYLVKNYNGFFFPRNSATMLSIKIKQLLKDSEMRKRLGVRARRTVAYSFSWERSINKIKRLLMESYYKKK